MRVDIFLLIVILDVKQLSLLPQSVMSVRQFITFIRLRIFSLSSLLRDFFTECAQLLICVQLFVTPWSLSPTGSSGLGDSPGKNTGVGCHALLQVSSKPRNRY